MALTATATNISTAAGTGNESFTGFGLQPKALISFYNNQTATGSTASGSVGIGFSGTAADDLSTYHSSLDAAAASDIIRSVLTNAFLKNTVFGATTARVTASLTSLDADGITINKTANVTASKFPMLALGGADITNAFGGSTTSTTGTTDVVVTGVGFQPDVIFLSAVLITGTGTANNNNSFSFGCARSTSERWATVMGAQNAQATMNNRRGFYDNRCLIVSSAVSDVTVDEYDFVSMDSDGFTISHPVASGTAWTITYLAVKGGQWKIGTFAQPSSTGNQSVTGVGFTPTGTMFAGANYQTANAMTPSSRITVGAATSSSNQQAVWMGDADNVPNALTDSRYVTDKCILHYTEAGAGAPTLDAEAQYVSNDSDGFTVNWTTADATARIVGYVCFGSNAVGGFTPTPMMHHMQISGGLM